VPLGNFKIARVNGGPPVLLSFGRRLDAQGHVTDGRLMASERTFDQRQLHPAELHLRNINFAIEADYSEMNYSIQLKFILIRLMELIASYMVYTLIVSASKFLHQP
jgi:hypothetical protein